MKEMLETSFLMGGYGVDLDGDKFSHVKCAKIGHSIFILKLDNEV
jgi:hypothetical protein